jgi:DNA-binding PucR family transcriptional regulator
VVVSKPFVIHRAAKSTSSTRTGEAIDIAARYFVYKLFDATGGNMALFHPVRALREAAKTVSRAAERGWVVVRDEGDGRAKQQSAALTEVGRLLARKALR